MRSTLTLAAMAALGLAAACAPEDEERMENAVETAAEETREAAGAAVAEAERAIMELDRAWSRRFQEKDTAWIARLHAEDARTMPPNAEPVLGRDAIGTWWGEMAGTEGLELSWEPTEAHVSSSEDMAYVVGTYRMTLPDGSTDDGKYLEVWVKEGGEWKVAADMFSSNLPPASGSG